MAEEYLNHLYYNEVVSKFIKGNEIPLNLLKVCRVNISMMQTYRKLIYSETNQQ